MILTYTNNAGQSLTMAAPDGMADTPYYVTGLEGAHGLEMDMNAVEQYPMDGSAFIGSRAKPREITISGIIWGKHKARDRVAMLELMRPKETGMLTATRDLWQLAARSGPVSAESRRDSYRFVRRIPCVIERAPYFARASGDRFTLTLYCAAPYWEDASGATDVEMSQWLAAFEFPLEIPGGWLEEPLWKRNDGIGFEFGTRAANVITNVVNPGDMPCGFVVDMFATGHVVNPAIVNVATGQRMGFSLTMESGDVLEISTIFAQKYATLTNADGERRNAFKDMTPNFTFFTLASGNNPLLVECGDGDLYTESTVRFRPMYLGL
ncbi:MAG: phage tail family protein [Oscillospiraceae bacterium]|jgi:hypothetical protein|nr:phage tail family protein [Oscillospiraceae bacterium]